MNFNDKKCLINRIRGLAKRPYNRGRIPMFASWAKMGTDERIKHSYENDKIVYLAKMESFANHIETAGRKTASIISYGTDNDNNLRLNLHVVYPTLRYNPNDTHSSFDNNFKGVGIVVGGEKLSEKVKSFEFDGILAINTYVDKLKVVREFYPANYSKALIEKITLENTSDNSLDIDIVKRDKTICLSKYASVHKEEIIVKVLVDANKFKLDRGERKTVNIAYCAELKSKNIHIEFAKEYAHRKEFLKQMEDKLKIETPSEVINNMAKFAKIRASESIFDTKGGLMHCPGGGGFYAAVWTNDQCEYVNPLFAYLGYDIGIEQSINCYNLYKKFIKPHDTIITSIIAEGDGIWHGAGDRGDNAMYAYGLARFLLARGDKLLATEYLPYLETCLKYTISKINSDGVVASDSDELENRFESGKANLCTSCLAYDALISNAVLFKELGRNEIAEKYQDIAEKLKENILKYFGANVEGYETFRYCKEEKRLRSWICMPMVVGINDRSEDTVNALLSDKLRKGNGLLTRSGEKTFWDRSLLYALRGLFNAGYADRAIELLESYSKTRLLGSHIPYAVEAFPEGNQAHLSAESGLYLRILTEGVLGLKFVGLGKFILKPNLPTTWNKFSIRNIHIGDKEINISVIRNNDGYEIKCEYKGEDLKQNNGIWAVK